MMKGMLAATRLVPALALALCLGARAAPPADAATADSSAAHGTRTLYLIRHGEYDQADPRDEEVGRGLVPLGREQSKVVGRRLARMPEAVTALHASTMTRARETAEIVGRELHLAPQPDPDLRECTPPTTREDILKTLEPGEADSCRTRIERAVARYFSPSPAGDVHEVLVCHGNVIRWFVCRALGVDPTAWGNMSIANASVTVIRVLPDGRTRLVSYDDVGHLPTKLRTYTSMRRAAPEPGRMK
jgi:serine/threonine-protein phosphatase PGAM5